MHSHRLSVVVQRPEVSDDYISVATNHYKYQSRTHLDNFFKLCCISEELSSDLCILFHSTGMDTHGLFLSRAGYTH